MARKLKIEFDENGLVPRDTEGIGPRDPHADELAHIYPPEKDIYGLTPEGNPELREYFDRMMNFGLG